jgi:hypothetical protein
MRLRLFLVLAALIALACAASGASASASASPETQLQANRTAARQDARQHLQRLRLPSAVTGIRAEPAFAKSLNGPIELNGRYSAGDDAFWTTSASPHAIIAYVQAHRPAGSTADAGSGSSSDTKTGVTSVDVQFSWPDLTDRVLNRTLTVTVVTPLHGRSVIVAQTQSDWFVPRSSSERVPRGVHAVAITLRLGPAGSGPVIKAGGHVQTSTYVVWRASRVRALVSEFNGLAIIQPSLGPIACPVILTGSEASGLTLAFKASQTGATLAHAQVSVHRGQTWDDGGGACDPISFWIGAKQQTPLASPTFVKQVGKLIGANIS